MNDSTKRDGANGSTTTSAVTPAQPEGTRALSVRAEREKSIAKGLMRELPRIAKALPRTSRLTPEQICRSMMNEIAMSPDLWECTPQSIFRTVMEAAAMGLAPNRVLGHIYPVAFKDNKKGITVCQTIVGYRGYLDIVRRSGNIQSVSWGIVHEGDVFRYTRGDDERIVHEPKDDAQGEKARPMTHAYCIFRLKDGGVQRVVMTARDVDRIRAKSKTGRNPYGPWSTDYEAMALKSTIRQAWKLLPVSIEDLRILELAAQRETGDEAEVAHADQQMAQITEIDAEVVEAATGGDESTASEQQPDGAEGSAS
jgi:recombination protein RecT